MGKPKENKDESTKKGCLKSIEDNWTLLLPVAIAASLTQPCLRWMGKEDNTLMFFLVYILIYLLAYVVTVIVLRVIKRIKG